MLVDRWDEAGCLHSILFEKFGEKDPASKRLAQYIQDMSSEKPPERPFQLHGERALAAVALLEEMRDNPDHVFSELADEMLAPVPEYVHGTEVTTTPPAPSLGSMAISEAA